MEKIYSNRRQRVAVIGAGVSGLTVANLLKDFGWTDMLDLGDISMSRYTEMLGAFWPAALNATGNMDWGFKLVR